MDPEHFDGLTKMLTGGVSRRRVLRGLEAALMGFLGRPPVKAATACPSGVVCSAQGCSHAGGICVSGRCTSCPSGVSCGGRCCANATDQCIGGVCCAHETVCGRTCLSNPCDATQLCCDPTTGTCVSQCPGGAACQGGQCGGVSNHCPIGLTHCNGICTDLQSDFSNCGACGHACPGIQDSACCGGACVRLFSDPANCGDCGCACPTGALCQRSPTGMGPICLCPGDRLRRPAT